MSEEGKCPISGNKSSSGGCPVGMGKKNSTNTSESGSGSGPTACPMQGDAGTNTTVGATVGCPVSPNNIYKWFTGVDITRDTEPSGQPYKNSKQYNVYSVEIDPKNQMPVKSAQEPSEGQNQTLSVNRVKSNIPKAGAENNDDGTTSTWSYPSPQMFWNSLVRKGKVEGAKEEDMETVVAVHNNMNEKTWDEVMKWEELKSNGAYIGGEAKLLRFMGKPFDLSPKARLKMIFGHPAPFDRHDWWIDQGGRINRYIIDYFQFHEVDSSRCTSCYV